MKYQYTYDFLKDEESLKNFLDILPELKDGESYMLILQTKSKYCPSIIKSDSIVNKRLVYEKSRIFNEIKKMEVPYGTYTNENGDIIPESGLSLYIKINPRSDDFIDISRYLLGEYKKDKKKSSHNAILDYIQDNPSKKRYQLFDFDIKKDNVDYSFDDLCLSLYHILGNTVYYLVETKGGYHLLVDFTKLDPLKQKTYYRELENHPHRDKQAKPDMHTPIVGCNQCEYIPKLHKFNI